MGSKTPGKTRGFTIIELIVALTISAITLVSGYELFEALKRAGDAQNADLAAAAAIGHGLDTIRADLWHAVPHAGSSTPVFVGTNPDPKKKADPAPLLEFYSLRAGPGTNGSGGLRQVYRVTYVLAQTQDSFCLYRSAIPLVGPGPTSEEQGRVQILDHVAQIALAFRNGRTTESSFSSNERLPVAVELTVTVSGRAWPLSVKLPCDTAETQP